MRERISEQGYRRFSTALFGKFGFHFNDADTITDVLLTADEFGIESHGISRILKYYNLLKDDVTSPKNKVEILRETPLTALFDAHGQMGQLAGKAAMELAIDKAGKNGLGITLVRNSNHYGIAGYYALLAAERGFIGLSLTNTQAIMVPTFASVPLIGSNPIAFAAPTGRKDPFLYDGATTVVTRGKLELYKKLGKELPYEWAVDDTGQTCSDPGRILDEIKSGSGGGILPLGGIGESESGYKGYGLGMIVEILTSVLAGGTSCIHKTDRGDTSHTFIAIDPQAFGTLQDFEMRLNALIDEIHAAKTASGQDHIFIAGEKEFRNRRLARTHGIAVSHQTLTELNRIAENENIEGGKKWLTPLPQD